MGFKGMVQCTNRNGNDAGGRRLVLFEATLFPGYVFSTCLMGYWVAYVVTLILFVFIGFLAFDEGRHQAGLLLSKNLPPIIVAMLVKTYLLRKWLFERVMTDQYGDVKSLRLYSMLFPAFIICN